MVVVFRMEISLKSTCTEDLTSNLNPTGTFRKWGLVEVCTIGEDVGTLPVLLPWCLWGEQLYLTQRAKPADRHRHRPLKPVTSSLPLSCLLIRIDSFCPYRKYLVSCLHWRRGLAVQSTCYTSSGNCTNASNFLTRAFWKQELFAIVATVKIEKSQEHLDCRSSREGKVTQWNTYGS